MEISWGLKFIAAVLQSNDFSLFTKNKITPELLNSEERPVYMFMREYYGDRRHYGHLPPMDLLVDRFPQHRLSEMDLTAEDLPVICDMLHRRQLEEELRFVATSISHHAAGEPWKGLELLLRKAYELRQLHEGTGDDLSLAESKDRIVSDLRIRLNSGGLIGLPWPWEVLNRATGGICSARMYGLYGRPKTQKSFLKILAGMHLFKMGYRILFVNTEMNAEEVLLRAAACLRNIDCEQLTLHPTEELITLMELELEALHETVRMEEFHGQSQRVRCFIVTDEVRSILDLRSKIEEVRPDIVLVDSAHELDDEHSTKKDNVRQQNVARGIRQLTRDKRLGRPPIVFSIHANRAGDKEIASGWGEIAGSDYWGKTCDAMFRLVRVRDPTTQHWVNAFLAPGGGGRHFLFDGMLLGAVPYTDMEFKRETTREAVMEMLGTTEDDGLERTIRRNTTPRRVRAQEPPARPVQEAQWWEQMRPNTEEGDGS